MFKYFSSAFLSLTIMTSMVPMGFAERVRIPISCECFTNEYAIYGEDDHIGVDRAPGADGLCSVTVELDPVVDTDNLPDPNEEGSLGVADVTGLASVASPLQVLFQQSNIKEGFVKLVSSIFKGHTEKYHAFLDEEVFGKAIASMSQRESSKDLETYLSSFKGKCVEVAGEPNPKPECVIGRAMCSYEKYIGVLFHETGQAVAQDAVEGQDTAQLIAALQSRDQALLAEAQHTQQAMDIAIAVYSQYFQTYRLHLRFKELIVNLARVRNMTGSMRELVGCIPNKFVGVATTKCN